jgi:hypothetical protein
MLKCSTPIVVLCLWAYVYSEIQWRRMTFSEVLTEFHGGVVKILALEYIVHLHNMKPQYGTRVQRRLRN